jgi:SAM-dependent methyltransferase
MSTQSPDTAAPNSQMIEFWNSVGGPKWVRSQKTLDAQLDAIGDEAIAAAGVRPGQSVLDVGCGCGSTTLELGQLVGEHGKVTGLDISEPMLELARQRAAQAGMKHVHFEQADAQTRIFLPDYDLLYSRFGVMFFDDPFAAFRNLRKALRVGGRMSFVCWQSLQKNPWMTVPVMAALKHVTPPTMPSPEEPGPFAFADADRLRRILEEADFHNVNIRGHDATMSMLGGAPDEEVADFFVELGPLQRMLQDATDEQKEAVRRELLDALATYRGPDGVRMDGAAWVVTAQV